MKRLLLLFVTAAALLGLTGCGGGSNSFTWFVDAIPSNLDPQVASASENRIACTNLYSGLFRLDEEDVPVPECVESYEVSPDGLTYTFRLKSGLAYKARKGANTEYAITADDFVFAFHRMFRASTASPYVTDFAAIRNSAAVLGGSLEESELGVRAADDLTLVITLSQKDDQLLKKLALPGAMPCDEEFFISTQGTYGLTSDSTITNGSFYLFNWTESGLFLRRTATGSQIDSLRLVQNTENTGLSAAELLNAGVCSAALDTTGADSAYTGIEYADTTWALLFNCDSALSSAAMRQALAASAYAVSLPLDESPIYSTAHRLIPDGVHCDGLDYASTAPVSLPALTDARTHYAEALAELPVSALSKLTLLVPDALGLPDLAQTVNGAWQKDLSLFFSIETVPEAEFQSRLQSGSYTIALAPLALTQDDPRTLLSQFASGGVTGYTNASLDTLLADAAATGGKEACTLLAQAETLVLDDCVAVPLFYQSKQLLFGSGISGLVFDPFGPVLDLTYTARTAQ